MANRENKDELIKWVVGKCFQKYFEMELQANSSHLPSMTSRWTETPTHSNDFHSSTESAAVKKASATEWVEAFHSNLDCLPELHRKLIQLKYLSRSSDGKYLSDDFVYTKLNLSRSAYYILKKEALYWLGIQLTDDTVIQSE
ncbi:ArpU family phage packaging/lysis transcriptional regulator [Lysinibacillus fusiformis]|uniref:ArpU family phage packaging/lysis transcriptional regulator n=1 Tax=Lysinibacillus fusiformis TaxID=28031 RepID=UPI002E9B62F8|nr:ArpU family phage packaging/lysis transcriptional regulator [Lysinibacillus fusiformis]